MPTQHEPRQRRRQRCIANSQGLTARLPGSRVGELPLRPITACVHFAPQNSPQIASCVVVPRRLALSLFLVRVVCRRVASSGEKRINTFTRLRSQVRVPQRPLRNRIRILRSQRSLARLRIWSLFFADRSLPYKMLHKSPRLRHQNSTLRRFTGIWSVSWKSITSREPCHTGSTTPSRATVEVMASTCLTSHS